jgi:cytoskeletal protein RodZ
MQIGEQLREAREEKALTLDDIQESTKIQKRYLVAIEQGDYHALPGKFYAKAFMKEYALAVGVDPQELLAGFDETNIHTDEEDNVQYTRLERSKNPRNARGSSVLSFLPTLIVIILVIGILFVAWTLYQQSLMNNNDNPNNQLEDDQIIRNKDGDDDGEIDSAEADDEGSAEEEKEVKQEEEQQPAGEFTVVEAGTGSSPLSTVDFTYQGDQVEVEFDVSEKTYIALQDEDQTYLQEGNVEANAELEPIDVTDKERIYFNIGNAPGATIVINGVELEYPVDANASVHQKIWVNLKKSE